MSRSKFFLNLCLLLPLVLAATATAQTWLESPLVVPFENDETTGTLLYHLAKLSKSGKLTLFETTDTAGLIGIVQEGAGKSGRSGIAQAGHAYCIFDGPTSSGDYVQPSTTEAGACHDAGTVFPSAGPVVGRVLSTNTGGGSFQIYVFPGETASSRNNTKSEENNSTATVQVAIPAAASASLPGTSSASSSSPTNSVQYNLGSSLAGVLNASSKKLFLTQTASGVPAFTSISPTDVASIASTDLSDSSNLIRSNQVALAGNPNPQIAAPAGTALTAFGDSITAGKGASSSATAYVSLIAAAKGWNLTNHALGGDGLFDQEKNWIWGSPVDASTLSLMMIGQNDASTISQYPAVWTAAYQAACLWLTLQNKTWGSMTSRSGTWQADATLSQGVYANTNNASVSTTTFGSVVYVVSRSLLSNNPTFTVTVDGTVYGPYTAPAAWTTMHSSSFAPYSIRIGNLSTEHHSVVVKNIGTGELHVDFIAGNKAQLSTTGPFLYTSTNYKVTSQWEFLSQGMNNIIRATVNQLAADGLGIVLADVEGDCANPTMVDTNSAPGGSNCSLYDGVHPTDSGHQIIANSFLRAIASTLIEAGSSSSYPSSPSFTSVTASTANLASVSSTTVTTNTLQSSGWLSLKAAGPNYWQISGSGHLVPNQNGGSSIGTDQTGALGVLNSPFSIRATNIVAGGYGMQTISGSPTLNLNNNTLVYTLNGNTSPSFIVSAGKGMRFTMFICQSGTGGYKFTWPDNVRNGMDVTQQPGSCSVQEFVQTGIGSSGDLVGVNSGQSFQP